MEDYGAWVGIAQDETLDWRERHATRLIDVRPDLANAGDSRGRTALMVAAMYGAVEMARMLIDRGSDMFVQDSVGLTPVRLAGSNANWCYTGHSQVLELLAERGASCDIHTAAGAGVLTLVKKLLEDELLKQSGIRTWCVCPNRAIS